MTIDTQADDLSGAFDHLTEGVLGHDYIDYEIARMLFQIRNLENQLKAFADVLNARTTDQDVVVRQLRKWLDEAKFKKEKADANG